MRLLQEKRYLIEMLLCDVCALLYVHKRNYQVRTHVVLSIRSKNGERWITDGGGFRYRRARRSTSAGPVSIA